MCGIEGSFPARWAKRSALRKALSCLRSAADVIAQVWLDANDLSTIEKTTTFRTMGVAVGRYGINATISSNSSGSQARMVVLLTFPWAPVASANAVAAFSSSASEIAIRS